MKILFWMFIGFDRNTTSEHLLSAMIRRLCEDGHSVHILQKDTGGPFPQIPQSLNGRSVTSDAISFQQADKGNLAARYFKDLQYIRACKSKITPEYDAVFIQSNNVAGFAVKMIRRILPHAVITYNVQDIFPDNAMYSGKLTSANPAFRILKAVQRYAYRNVDHLITISEDMKETLIRDGAEDAVTDVIYNWSYQDAPYEKLDLSPVRFMFSEGLFHVVYAGNIGVMQGVNLLVNTACLMKDDPDVRFHIIGDGVYCERLKTAARENELTNIDFWPMQTPDKAPLIYQAASVNVIPLVKNIYKTALPSKTATCLACGKPIVFAIGKDSQFASKVSIETGCPVIEPDQPEDLCKVIRQLKETPGQIHTEDCFKKHFQITANSRRYAELITKR